MVPLLQNSKGSGAAPDDEEIELAPQLSIPEDSEFAMELTIDDEDDDDDDNDTVTNALSGRGGTITKFGKDDDDEADDDEAEDDEDDNEDKVREEELKSSRGLTWGYGLEPSAFMNLSNTQ